MTCQERRLKCPAVSAVAPTVQADKRLVAGRTKDFLIVGVCVNLQIGISQCAAALDDLTKRARLFALCRYDQIDLELDGEDRTVGRKQ